MAGLASSILTQSGLANSPLTRGIVIGEGTITIPSIGTEFPSGVFNTAYSESVTHTLSDAPYTITGVPAGLVATITGSTLTMTGEAT